MSCSSFDFTINFTNICDPPQNIYIVYDYYEGMVIGVYGSVILQ